jgi:hypothetical protein
MDKLMNRYIIIFVVGAVMAFLSMNNLFADGWVSSYYYAWEYETSDNTQETSHYLIDIDTDAYLDDVNNTIGIDFSGYVTIVTEAKIMSKEEEYSNSFYLSGEGEIGCERDLEWDGPPGESTGFDIRGYLYANATQNLSGYRDTSEAIAEASGYTGGWAEASAYDSGYGSDAWTVGMDSEGYVDNEDADEDFSILSIPDSNSWTPTGGQTSYGGNLFWNYYNSSIDYEVSEGLAWVSMEALAYGCASSDVYLNADESEHDETIYSYSTSTVNISAYLYPY